MATDHGTDCPALADDVRDLRERGGPPARHRRRAAGPQRRARGVRRAGGPRPARPAGALLGYLALADGPFRGETSPRAAACVASALGSARRMRRLVDDLLAYATLDARPGLGPVALPDLVREVRVDLAPELSRAGADVTYAGPDRPSADPTLLRQLVQNLVGNAVAHARPGVGPRVLVRAGTDGAAWWLEVADNGPGIAVEQRERVFDPLVRLTGRAGGSGLGLATCARVAQALGGTIAAGEAPGGGAALRVTLPVRDPSPPPARGSG